MQKDVLNECASCYRKDACADKEKTNRFCIIRVMILEAKYYAELHRKMRHDPHIKMTHTTEQYGDRLLDITERVGLDNVLLIMPHFTTGEDSYTVFYKEG